MKRRKNPILQRIEYAIYRGAVRVIMTMSEERAARLGMRVGELAKHILRGRDRMAIRNLGDAFPEMPQSERRRVIDDCWRHFGRELVEYIRIQELPLDEIAARCPFVNFESVEEA